MTFRKAPRKPRYPLGQIAITPGADELLAGSDTSITDLLERHATGDWGKCCPEDAEQNDEAVAIGERTHSVYEVGGQDLWVITERDRSVTTLLLPSDY